MTFPEPRTPNELPANPFRPGNGVAPPYLAGRDPLLNAFESFISQAPLHPNWTVTGLRGTGKTVLLAEFAARAECAGWVTLQRELGDRHRDDRWFAEAIDEDCDALARRVSMLANVSQAIAGGVRQLRPRRLTVGEVGYEPAYEDRPVNPADRMRVSLTGLNDTLVEVDRPGALLLYDEAHLLVDDRSRERFPLSGLLAALGTIQRDVPRVRVVLSGLPTLSLNLKRARTYAERMFRHAVVGNLERDDAWSALGIPMTGCGRSFALSLMGEIVDTTGGYPYFLQFFGAYICRSVSGADVTTVEFRRVEPTLLHELDLAFFDDRFEAATPTEQRVMAAMARQAGRVRVGELRRDLPDLAGHDVLLRRLIDRGLVYRAARGTYAFALPLFRDYLRRRDAHPTELTGSVRSVRASPRSRQQGEDA